jgi:ComEC/Rec2-related protein
VTVTSVRGWSDGSPVERAANRVRRTLADGAGVLPREERSLYLGFVLGDDREQPEPLRATFRAAGLAHLTAVSGQNVALALAVVGPLLRRLGLRSRVIVTVGVIAWFALLTRFEPSVLRAAAMASLAAVSVFLARPASGIRLLALATTGLLLVDPLLVWSVGFLLSVGATAGIVLLSRPLAARLPGPRGLALALAVTAAAQVGVAPVQLAVFGPLPLAALPANLLAGPVAGPVMVWGLPAGLAAGVLPDPLPSLLHLPTLLGVRWIALVARVAEAAPLGHVGAPAFAGAAVGGGVIAAWVVFRKRTARSVAGMTWADATPEQILERSTNLAVVGCSTHDWKHAHDVPRALQRRGFRIIPVHPTADAILGERAYPVLADVPDEIDTVVVFRPSPECGGVAQQAVAVGAKAVWLQLGLASAEARAAAEAAGLGYVEDRCTKVVAAQLGLRK